MEPVQSLPPGSDDYIGYQLLGVGIACIGIQSIFVALRLWGRSQHGAKLDWDDYLIYPAVICSLVVDSLICAIVIDGKVGYHITYLEATQPQVIKTYTKILFAVEGVYLAAEALSKLSILFLYLRFFRERLHRLATYALIGVIIATYIGETIAWVLQCTPPSDFWEKTPQEAHCFNRQLFYGFLNVPNIITDVAALALAGLMVRKLHLSGAQKVGLFLTFMTGLLGTAASIARCVTFFTLPPFTDPTWNSTILLIWTVAEPATYVVVACLPSLRVLSKNRRSMTADTFSGSDKAGGRNSFASFQAQPQARKSDNVPLSQRLKLKRTGEMRDFYELDAPSETSSSPFAQTWKDNGGIMVTNDVEVMSDRRSPV